MQYAIEVENLGKRYVLDGRAGIGNYKMLRESLTHALLTPMRWLKKSDLRSGSREFWALKDLSFNVRPGEVVGIIGRNGAGKSTLLKLLSRITKPTLGEIRINGHVGSLLEVGTGFHPELTGRENIYLNGSILGMSRRDVSRQFDAIVDFSEIRPFLDTPVKRYSSGMYVRLAFAVAAHLNPEILIVDEVLAVGDVEFQRKCLGKMKEVASGQGRTVLFVSHNMAAVRSLCQSGILLDKGRMVHRGTAQSCIEKYLSANSSAMDASGIMNFSGPESAPLRMTTARVLCDGAPSNSLPMGGQLAIEVDFVARVPVQHPRIGLVISDADGNKLINTNNRFQPSDSFNSPTSRGTIRANLGQVPFVAGRYTVSLFLGGQVDDTHIEQEALWFEVIPVDIWGAGKVPPSNVAPLWWPLTVELIGESEMASSTADHQILSRS